MVTCGPRPTVDTVSPSGVRSVTRAGTWAMAMRLNIGMGLPQRRDRGSASNSRGCQPGTARRTSSWWTNISVTLTSESSSLNGEYSGGPAANLATSASQSVDSAIWFCTLAV